MTGEFDAVLTATALHWLPEDRIRVLYGEIASVLRPGGIFCNADHMVDPGLLELTRQVEELRKVRREAVYAGGEVLSWSAWWEAARNAPELADAVAERDTIYAESHGDSLPVYTAHLEFLRVAGFREVGLVWRGLTDAAFAAVR